MSYCQETTNYYYNSDIQDKQKIQYILDDNNTNNNENNTNIPQIVNNNLSLSSSTTSTLSSSLPSTTVNNNNNYQFVHYKDQEKNRLLTSSYSLNQDKQPDTPPLEDSRPPPTANELQYIKRIHTLMNLVAKQTKEIRSLRSIIEAYSQNENNDCCSINNRKRNKQF
ncbi:hypothetical protein INT46_011653 [Mucor plumbeus]|jgi:hypothetical protein|uniref:Uncharacterized protein n=1 Tax=Mucor plumbeus TaxID=97098 RepID=A0A8H7US54_9FUNG|nr:hypothetical protein INT46_011653 [Mucor plumbeus]